MTEQQIKEVEELAGCQFSKEEIVLIMGLDPKEFDADRVSQEDFGTAYLRGKLLVESKVRKSIFDLAINGSSPAQALAINMINKSRLNDLTES